MNNSYLIDLYSPKEFNGKGKYVASSKARNDVTCIMEELGVKRIPIVRSTENKIWGVLQVMLKVCWCLLKLPKTATIYVQYPMINITAFVRIASLFKKFHSVVIVHDIRTYCHDFLLQHRSKEIEALNCFKQIIVHSEAMKARLIADGVKSNMIVLGAFDYLLFPDQKIIKDKNGIVFAGALQKSTYLKDLHKVPQQNIHFNLYGAQKPEITYLPSINYKGRFAPNDVSTIEGDWGLMWDGEGIDSCGGKFGDYLHLIAPHKFSLYIACGLKVIIWEESAMAPLVKEKKLGITIRRLNEIEEKISSLTDEEKAIIERNVAEMSKSIRRGDMLKIALNKLY